jgi:septum formation protein
MSELLLASKSMARRRMLEAAGVPFTPVDAPFDEERAKTGLSASGSGARNLALELARLKAGAAEASPGALVLGADQVLELGTGAILSKPASRDEAREQLRAMAGRTHWLHSAAAIAEGGRPAWSALESVAMTMRPLTDGFIESYLDREYEAVRWNVGGYRIEGEGVQLFDKIEGSHFAILGLPLLPLLAYLRERGVLAG